MSGGSGQTTTNDVPGWVRPYAEKYLQGASDLSQKPYQEYGGKTVAGMDPTMQAGLTKTAELGMNGTAAGNAGTQALTDTLSGKWLGGNPYLTSQIDQAQGDVVRNFNTVAKPQMENAMARSGSFGNAGLQQMQAGQYSDLQKNLGNISSGMRFNAYNTERQNMQGAMGMAPQFNNMALGNATAATAAGQAQQQQNQAELTDSYQRWLQKQGWDANQLGILGNALGTMRGGTTNVQGSAASPFGSMAGGALVGSQIGGPWGAAVGGGLGYLFSR